MQTHKVKQFNWLYQIIHGKWCWRRDSNSQPPDYKSGALPIEPRQHVAHPLPANPMPDQVKLNQVLDHTI